MNSYSKQLSIARPHPIAFGKLGSLILSNPRFLVINMGLLALAMASLIFYIFLANHLVSQEYKTGLMRNELNELVAKSASLGEGMGSEVSLEELNYFAQNAGMVRALEHDVVFTSSDVAIGR